jgi:hypothetical protein
VKALKGRYILLAMLEDFLFRKAPLPDPSADAMLKFLDRNKLAQLEDPRRTSPFLRL